MYLENNRVRRYPILAAAAWLMVVLWMALIFFLSHQTGSESGDLSRLLAEGVLKLFQQPATESQIDGLENILRILAHGSSFFVLAFLTSWAFTCIAIQDFRNALLSLIICVLYAASDELHQAFVPGRASQLTDFLTDTAGIVLAILIFQLFSVLRYLRTDLRVKREEDLRV